MYPALAAAALRNSAHSHLLNSFRAFLLLALATAAAAQPAVQFQYHQYPSARNPQGIAVGPDGRVWSTDLWSGTNSVYSGGVFDDRITPGFIGTAGIAFGPDKTVWWSEPNASTIVQAPVGKNDSFYTVSGHPYAVATAADCSLWFAEPNEGRIGFVTPAGTITEFPMPVSTDAPNSLAFGPDGNIWFTLQDHAAIGRITPAGVVTEFPVAANNAKLRSMTSGPDGALWFVDTQNGAVLRSTVNGQIQQFSVLPDLPTAITSGPGGALWFPASAGNHIDLGRITVDGAITIYPDTTGDSLTPTVIAAGTDNGLYFPVIGSGWTQLVIAEVLDTPMVRVTTTALPAATVGTNYQTTLAATGGTPPYHWYAYPLPAGLAVDAATGVISGVPQTPGTCTVPVRATDKQGAFATQDLTLVVNPVLSATPTITTKALPGAVQTVAYSQTLMATGGSAPYKWTVLVGSLPDGLALNAASGVVSGVPVKIGMYSFIVQATDSAGASNAAALAITVNARPDGPARVGAFSQVASGAGWKTSLYISNISASAADLTLYFWADNGSPLTLPLTVTQTGGAQTLSASNWSGTIGANSTVLLETSGPAGQNLTGWAEVLSAGSLSGYGVFHYTSAAGIQSEATVPMETKAQWNMLVPYELNSGFQAGIAMNNWSCADALPGSFTFYDAAGNSVGSTPVSMDPCSHQSFMLSDRNAALNGNRGLLKFFPTGGDGLTGLGIRVNPAGGITSTPLLEPVGPQNEVNGEPMSGVFSHVAAGGGWKTSLYLVNPVPDTTTVTVKIHADPNLPAELPLRITQGGKTSEVTTASTTLTLAPNETVLLESNTASDTAWTGWVQVASRLVIAGYGVFHYTSPAGVESEGTVTLDNPGVPTYSLALPYEAAGNFQMGVALANLEGVATTVTATAYDISGVKVGTATVDLGAAGHKSLMLSELIPATAGNRGFLLFKPSGDGLLAGLGIRVNPTGGFTSAPTIWQGFVF